MAAIIVIARAGDVPPFTMAAHPPSCRGARPRAA
jgi:hypothetical protein